MSTYHEHNLGDERESDDEKEITRLKSEYDRLKAQKDAIIERYHEKLLAPLRDQLTASLATVAQLRDRMEEVKDKLRRLCDSGEGMQYVGENLRLMADDIEIALESTPPPAVVQVAKVLPVLEHMCLAGFRDETAPMCVTYEAPPKGKLTIGPNNCREFYKLLNELLRALTPATKG